MMSLDDLEAGGRVNQCGRARPWRIGMQLVVVAVVAEGVGEEVRRRDRRKRKRKKEEGKEKES